MTEEQNNEMLASLRRIETGLFGDEKIGVTGMVARQREHESRISSLEKWRIYLLGGGGAIALCWAVFVVLFKK